jgi:protein-S-isoprenylcysteine O-methyltransferase Ste14
MCFCGCAHYGCVELNFNPKPKPKNPLFGASSSKEKIIRCKLHKIMLKFFREGVGISKEGSEKEGRVRDLVEKLKRGEINSKDALKELGKRGLLEPESWEIVPWAAYFVLWLLPFVSNKLELDFLVFFAQLPSISFPKIVIYVSVAIGILGIVIGIWVSRMHSKMGGLNHDETVILLKEGPYGVMRHPATLYMILPILLPIILSTYIPFTPLAIAAVITMIVYVYYSCLLEEKRLDIPKWGIEYLQYMKEVPRFNFILGLWRRKRRKKR